MSNIDPVVLRLEADLRDFSHKIGQAERLSDQKLGAIEAKGFAMGQSLKRSFNVAQAAALAYAATAGVSALTGAIKEGLDYASSLGEQAQQLGISTAALQEYRFAATQVGLSADEMDQAISQLTRRIGEAATGTKAQAEAFQKLGVSVRDANGNVKSAADLIPEIADGYRKLGSEAERTAIGTDLFGKSAYKLGPLLAGGSKGINELRDAAHRLGIVLDGNLIANADEAADKLAALQTVLKAKIAGAVAANAGAIIQFANALGTLIDYAGRADAALKKFQRNYKEYIAEQKVTRGLTSGVQAEGVRELRQIAMDRKSESYDELTKRAGLTMSVQEFVGGGAPRGGGSSVPAAATPRGGGSGGGSTGPTAKEIARRFDAERASLMGQYNQALASMATSADEAAELELRAVELARIRANADIKNTDEYDKAKKEQLSALVDEIAEVERNRVEFERKRRLEKEAQDLADEQHKVTVDALQGQLGLADTQAARRKLALALLDAEMAYLKSKLEAVVASESATAAEKERARVALAGMEASRGAQAAQAERDTEGPLAQYLRRNDPAKNGERAEQLVVDELDHVQRGISSALSNAIGAGDDPLISGLIDMLLQDILFRPLAEALEKGGGLFGGGGGGLFGNLLGGLFGGLFADGGRPPLGKVSVVGERGPELFVPDSAGTVVPNHLIGRNLASGGGGETGGPIQLTVTLSEDLHATIDNRAAGVAVQVNRQMAPEVIKAASNYTLKQASRPKL